MTDFGGGIYLTNNTDTSPVWDLKVDGSGDVKTVQGIDELNKDIAYSTAVRLGEEVGERLDPTTLNRINSKVRRSFEDEARIDSIIILDVNHIDDNRIEVTATVQADDEDIELVFEVSQ